MLNKQLMKSEVKTMVTTDLLAKQRNQISKGYVKTWQITSIIIT